ncbi:CaiB/BaiF CoA transferase family protein [Chloroflexota bacterium]
MESGKTKGMPLDGLRICSFEQAWAGPHCSRLLADFGAEVIGIESHTRVDVQRTLAPFADNKPGLNRTASFNSIHRNKLGVTLDLKKPKAVELAKEIVKISDVVMTNYTPRAIKSLGLDYDNLKEIKPDIIFLGLSGYGATGPEKDYVAYGATISYVSGMASLTGYMQDDIPRHLGYCTADVVTGTHAAFAILAALHHQAKTGEGQEIDISMCESNMAFIPEAIMDFVFNGVVRGRMGNRDEWMAPHGCYRCKGEDKWISITIRADEEWRRLCAIMGNNKLAHDERFSDTIARWQHQSEMDTLIEEWTANYTHYEVMEMLQEADIPAGCCLNSEELLADRHLNDREYWVEVNHPETGVRRTNGPNWKLSETPAVVFRPAPLLGEYNEYVFKQLLGLSEREIAKLAGDEVIY